MLTSKLLLLFYLVAPPDTTINGVKVEFSYSQSIFPLSWQGAPIQARGEGMAVSEIPRSKSTMVVALNKYPAAVLKQELKAVYFVRTMKFYDVSYGGTNSENAVYLCNDGLKLGYTASYLEQTFHHEFSSILFRNHPDYLDTAEWKNANAATFDYNDPENGVGSIRNNRSSQDIDSILMLQGFLTQYSQSSLENDINTVAQNLFCPPVDFWQIVEKYPRIKKKTKLLIAFYNRISPVFNEDYFKKIEERKKNGYSS